MNDELRIDTALTHAAKQLSDASDSPRLDAELLLCRTLDVTRSYLFAHPDDTLDALATERFESLLQRRASGLPMAYIEGRREFWSLPLMVSPATLIPRPDTEILVQQALMLIPRESAFSVVDLGTGSGAIALALANERPLASITATDCSKDALAIAQENARQLGISNVEFRAGNWTAAVTENQYDLIVSNPPYVAENDPALAALSFEPQTALRSGADGLADIRLLSRQCPTILKPGGTMLLEHGADQQSAVERILLADHWTNIACVTDLAGLPRVTSASFNADIDVSNPSSP